MNVLDRVRRPLSTFAFVWLLAAIGATMSERMFWYWQTSPASHLEAAVFYSLPVAAALWLMARHGVGSWPQVVLASTTYAYVTEGVITPVMYSGGPFVPFFPVWFTAWHGLLAFCLLTFGLRWLLLQRRRAQLLGVAAAIGVCWGAWLTTSALPENVGDDELVEHNGELELLSDGDFSLYALSFTLIIIAAHWLVGHVWPTSWHPSRTFRWTVAGLCLLAATVWSAAYLWALPMFLAYTWLTDRLLRRFPTSAHATVLDRLAGRVRVVDLSPLLVMAPAAAATYTGINALEPSETALRIGFYGTIVTQTLAALVVLIWSAWRGPSRQDSTGETVPSRTLTPVDV